MLDAIIGGLLGFGEEAGKYALTEYGGSLVESRPSPAWTPPPLPKTEQRITFTNERDTGLNCALYMSAPFEVDIPGLSHTYTNPGDSSYGWSYIPSGSSLDVRFYHYQGESVSVGAYAFTDDDEFVWQGSEALGDPQIWVASPPRRDSRIPSGSFVGYSVTFRVENALQKKDAYTEFHASGMGLTGFKLVRPFCRPLTGDYNWSFS
jgi:hypothetical protein